MAVFLHRTTSAFSLLKLNHSWNDTLVSHPCWLYQSSALNPHPAQQKEFRSQVAQTPCNPAGGTFTLFLEKTQLHQWFFPQWPGKHIHSTSVLRKATWRIVYTILSYNPWGALSFSWNRQSWERGAGTQDWKCPRAAPSLQGAPDRSDSPQTTHRYTWKRKRMTGSFFSCDWRKLSNQTAWLNKEKVQKRVSATWKTELGHILKVYSNLDLWLRTEKKKSFGLKYEANLKTFFHSEFCEQKIYCEKINKKVKMQLEGGQNFEIKSGIPRENSG